MLLHQGAPPFELGETLKGTDEGGNLIQTEVLGKAWTLKIPNKQGERVVAVAMRNVLGAALLGGRLGQRRDSAGFPLFKEVDGYAITLAEQNVVVIDPYLPAAGVADDDIFWGIIEGPVEILTPFAGADFNDDIAVGGRLVAGTVNTTNGNTTAGRIANVTLPGTTGATKAFEAALGFVGTALSARTTGETNEKLLTYVNIRL